MPAANILEITSAANEKFKIWKSLLTSKGLRQESLAIYSGPKLLRELVAHAPQLIQAELRLAKHLPLSQAPQFILSKELFSELDELGTHSNLFVLRTPSIPLWQNNLQAGLVLFLPLGDPGNLGATIRSAVGFGVSQIVLTKESCHPFLPKALKAASGSILKAPLYLGPALQDIPSECIALAQGGVSLENFQWPKLTYLVVGEEGLGLQKFAAHTKVSINTKQIESLNASVAASLALYAWSTCSAGHSSSASHMQKT